MGFGFKIIVRLVDFDCALLRPKVFEGCNYCDHLKQEVHISEFIKLANTVQEKFIKFSFGYFWFKTLLQ